MPDSYSIREYANGQKMLYTIYIQNLVWLSLKMCSKWQHGNLVLSPSQEKDQTQSPVQWTTLKFNIPTYWTAARSRATAKINEQLPNLTQSVMLVWVQSIFPHLPHRGKLLTQSSITVQVRKLCVHCKCNTFVSVYGI
jgi:hypothetical protein